MWRSGDGFARYKWFLTHFQGLARGWKGELGKGRVGEWGFLPKYLLLGS